MWKGFGYKNKIWKAVRADGSTAIPRQDTIMLITDAKGNSEEVFASDIKLLNPRKPYSNPLNLK
jgi:hypothetical protein